MLREPFIQFLLGGLILASALHFTRRAESPEPWPDIVVREQAGTLAESLGRPLADSDLPQLRQLLTDEEVLFREALARGLHLDDPVIRQRLAGKVTLLLTHDIPEPTEEELRRYYQENPDLYRPPPDLSFIHVYFAAGSSPAPDTLEQLRRGTNPGSLGQPFPQGRQWRNRSAAEIHEVFGPSFLDLLRNGPAHSWHGPLSSPLGQHFVFLTETILRPPRSFDDSRDLVRRHLLDERDKAALRMAIETLANEQVLPELPALPTP